MEFDTYSGQSSGISTAATYNTRWKMPLRDVLPHSGPSAESPGISENSPSCGHFDADDERT